MSSTATGEEKAVGDRELGKVISAGPAGARKGHVYMP